jgi:hypothetical protein
MDATAHELVAQMAEACINCNTLGKASNTVGLAGLVPAKLGGYLWS